MLLLAVALRCFLLRVLQQFLHFLAVPSHRRREARELVGHHLGVREPHDRRPDRLSEGTTVYERRVAESRVPGEIVVDRVIDPAAVFTTVIEIERRDAEVLQERRIVRS